MTVSMTPQAVAARLRHVAAISDLTSARRLYCKIDMSPKGIAARLREVEALRRACVQLGRLKAQEPNER